MDVQIMPNLSERSQVHRWLLLVHKVWDDQMMDAFLPRYRVTLTVTDGTTVATVLLFESAARKLFVLSAKDAKQQGEDGSMPTYMKSGVVGIERMFYLMLNTTEALDNWTDFVVNNIEGVDGSASGEHVRAVLKTPTKKSNLSPSAGPTLKTPTSLINAVIAPTPESAVQVAAGIKAEPPTPKSGPVKHALEFTNKDEAKSG